MYDTGVFLVSEHGQTSISRRFVTSECSDRGCA